jgi:tetratricopeptide (TPR) repeat protein
MRLGRLPPSTGDLRSDALGELRWAMASTGLTIEKLLVMESVLQLPVIAAALDGVEPAAAPRAALDALMTAARGLGDGPQARLLRNALAIDYDGSGKDLTARRIEFVRNHNDAARAAGSRNFLPETTRALYAIEQQVLESLVTALGAPGRDAPAVTRREPKPVTLPRQLPATTVHFSGRADALAWLDASLSDEPGLAPTVLAIDGTAGVGKTALALHWAHRVAARFPDGQLYIDLRGHSRDGDPVSHTIALNHFLQALGVPPENRPADEKQLAGVYRSATAGKRLLIVLDNAATTEQVGPLIPGEPGCTVLVTSRNALPGLVVTHDARVLTLDALRPVEAQALLGALAGPERAGADPAATAELAALCGLLPLALRIVAAKLQAEPQSSVTDMLLRLRKNDRLTALEFGRDSEIAVRAAFELSYDSLPAAEQRVFRLLGLVPGMDVTHDAVAALLDTDTATAGQLLDALAAGHLISRQPRLRYQFHDLLREYAKELCAAVDPEDERAAAVERLLTFYVHRTIDATRLLHPRSLRLPGDEPEGVPPSGLADRDAAIAWLTDEQPNLTAAVLHAQAHGAPTAAWRLAYAMRSYFLVGPGGLGWLAVGPAGLAGAIEAGHYHAVSAMHGLLGRSHRMLGDLPTAAQHIAEALAASEAAGWAKGEVIAHCTLGGILQDQGRLAEAITHHEAALAIERALGDPNTGGVHLANIAAVLTQIGEFADAVPYCEGALDLMRRNGDERGVAVSMEVLGAAFHQLGRLADAATHVTGALAEYRRMGFRDLEAEGLCTLARICCDAGEVDAARRHAAESWRLAGEVDDARIEVVAANTAGAVALRAGDPQSAAGWHRQALDLATGIGYRVGHVAALVGLAATAVETGPAAAARARAEEALAAARDAELRALEAEALVLLGRTCSALGDRAAAEAAYTAALAIRRAAGAALAQAETERLLAAEQERRGA